MVAYGRSQPRKSPCIFYFLSWALLSKKTKLGYSGPQICIIPIKFTWWIYVPFWFIFCWMEVVCDKVQHWGEDRKFSGLLWTGQWAALNHIGWKEARQFNRQEVPLFRRQLSCGSQIKMEVVANWQNIYGPRTQPWACIHALASPLCRLWQLPTARCPTVSCLVLRTERNLGSLSCELRGTKGRINTASIFYWAAWSSSCQHLCKTLWSTMA